MARLVPWLLFLLAGAAEAVVLDYGAEWRLARAGWARMTLGEGQAQLLLQTTGLVGAIYPVKDDYKVSFNESFCASSTLMNAEEGRKHREISVAFHDTPGKADRVERDLNNNGEVVESKQIDVPACVHDIIAGLSRMRHLEEAPGKTIYLPISDGKKSVNAKVEVQARERVKTPAGEFDAIRYEAFLHNGVLFRRKARLFVWISDDEKRLPVQIRVKMPFYLGTVTLQLEKQWYD